jgi:hypothetical protein
LFCEVIQRARLLCLASHPRESSPHLHLCHNTTCYYTHVPGNRGGGEGERELSWSSRTQYRTCAPLHSHRLAQNVVCCSLEERPKMKSFYGWPCVKQKIGVSTPMREKKEMELGEYSLPQRYLISLCMVKPWPMKSDRNW